MSWNGKIGSTTDQSPAVRPLGPLTEEPSRQEKDDAAVAAALASVTVPAGANDLPISQFARKTDGYGPRS